VVHPDASGPRRRRSYLVVAADKGTATFSDTANGVAEEYGFWLGDAFASGGAPGSTTRTLGITAAGVGVGEAPLPRAGIDIMSTPFTVVGIGDMSGDVFGNGMLLSPFIRLVAAFDHRHVFVDPDPDPAVSFAERADCSTCPGPPGTTTTDRSSPSGGRLRSEGEERDAVGRGRAALGIPDDVPQDMTPNDLIKAILKAPVDLLWNGGIGTYVKSADETSADVGDRANDGVRITWERHPRPGRR
jgi:glutamate dehydrogenase